MINADLVPTHLRGMVRDAMGLTAEQWQDASSGWNMVYYYAVRSVRSQGEARRTAALCASQTFTGKQDGNIETDDLLHVFFCLPDTKLDEIIATFPE